MARVSADIALISDFIQNPPQADRKVRAAHFRAGPVRHGSRCWSTSPLGRAVAELGRISKTLYLLTYLDDDSYRRRILTQLNRTEGRYALARAIFHGHRGQLRQRYREGQEDQLGALGLVINALVLWNTHYMDATLGELRHEGLQVADDDVKSLSPLGHEHINFFGRYQFSMPDLPPNQLRPLRDPNTQD